MTGWQYSPLHVTELCREMQGKFIVGSARLIKFFFFLKIIIIIIIIIAVKRNLTKLTTKSSWYFQSVVFI